MLLIDKLLVGGVRFVLDKLSVAADQELNDDSHLREALLAAQLQVELGELSQAQFEALEDEVLARIREIRAQRGEQGAIGFSQGTAGPDGEARSLEAGSISSIEADFVADDWYPEAEVEGQVVESPAPPLAVVKPVRTRAAKKPAGKGANKPARKATRKPAREATKKPNRKTVRKPPARLR